MKELAEREKIPIYQFNHKDDVANRFRQRRGVRDGVVFIGVAQEKAQAFQGKKINGRLEFTRDKTVYVNRYYFYIDDEDFGLLFLKVCSYAPWGTKLCLNGHEHRASPHFEKQALGVCGAVKADRESLDRDSYAILGGGAVRERNLQRLISTR